MAAYWAAKLFSTSAMMLCLHTAGVAEGQESCKHEGGCLGVDGGTGKGGFSVGSCRKGDGRGGKSFECCTCQCINCAQVLRIGSTIQGGRCSSCKNVSLLADM